jgi:hypothetical protein
VPRGLRYPLGVVSASLTPALRCTASLRGAAEALELFRPAPGQPAAPHRSTGRLWLPRVGLAALRLPKVTAADWVRMIDHSIQIGATKCLVILGVRSGHLPAGRPLSREDMERLPGTTEVLESRFGRLKAPEAGQSKSGFTGLVLSLGAPVGRLEPARVQTMPQRVRVREVIGRCREQLGITIQSRRRALYEVAWRATELG